MMTMIVTMGMKLKEHDEDDSWLSRKSRWWLPPLLYDHHLHPHHILLLLHPPAPHHHLSITISIMIMIIIIIIESCFELHLQPEGGRGGGRTVSALVAAGYLTSSLSGFCFLHPGGEAGP